jgi:hypothetical protein
MTKELMIDAIVGQGFRSMQKAIEYEKLGYAKFTGNQYNEDWSWKRDELKKLTLDVLCTIYYNNRKE